MPIYNGKYIAPLWANNAPPAINQTELQAITDTVEDSQIIHGSGVPTQATAATVGQLYVDDITDGIFRCVGVSGNSYDWISLEDNLARPYDPTDTYDQGQYCTWQGILYRAVVDIDPPEADWDATHWTRIFLADDLSAHVGDTNNPHGVTAAQAGYDNTDSGLSAENAQDAIDELAGDIDTLGGEVSALETDKQDAIHTGSISLGAVWSGTGPYIQTAMVTGATVTANSRVSLELTAAQIEALTTDGVVAMVVENNNGVLTVYAIGAAPSAGMNVQCTVMEVEA